ncbi:MAG: transcription termination factor NusA [Candidatus Berkelbacteria bacterium]|nr:transcription termination factor NusA [Candidatus Berkelbacteria bacterium]
MQIAEFMTAIKQLADEKGLSEETILDAVESALAAAYRKDYGKSGQVIKAKLDVSNNSLKIWRALNVIADDEEITNSEAQISETEAKKIKKKISVGDQIEFPLETKSDFGRVAAQTAKQVIIQKLREAERKLLYEEFKNKEKKIVAASVQRVEGPNVIVDLGKINGIMLPQDQIPGERYYTGQRVKVWVSEVDETSRGPRILVSRSAVDFIKELFVQEVPELESGSIEITEIAREPGSRTKIAVSTNDENLDPVGSIVGQRGTRVQSVLAEIPNEKIDIILYDKDPEAFVTNALSPAKIDKIKFNKKQKSAKIWVPEDQLSLAIGKGGQNVRLASKISGWTIDIVKEGEERAKKPRTKDVKEEKAEEKTDQIKKEVKKSPPKKRAKRNK